eukprot:1545387-Rhodomonas_salina.2
MPFVPGWDEHGKLRPALEQVAKLDEAGLTKVVAENAHKIAKAAFDNLAPCREALNKPDQAEAAPTGLCRSLWLSTRSALMSPQSIVSTPVDHDRSGQIYVQGREHWQGGDGEFRFGPPKPRHSTGPSDVWTGRPPWGAALSRACAC